MKRTPELSFRPDPAVREGARIESLLAADDRPITTTATPADELDEPAP